MRLKNKFAEYLVELQSGGRASLRMGVRNAVRALWTGTWGLNEFYDQMILALEKGMVLAFEEGLAEYGMTWDELNPSEQGELFQFLYEQSGHIDGFGQDIIQNNKASGGKLGPHMQRAEMWISRYDDALNRARIFASSDRHLRWTLGAAEHCSSCLKLAGKVKRGSIWLARNIRPQHPNLECKGFNCACSLVPTNEPASRGPLPKIP